MTVSTEDRRSLKPVTIPYTPWNPSSAHLVTPVEIEVKRAKKKKSDPSPSMRQSDHVCDLLRKRPGIHTPQIVSELRKNYGIEANANAIFRV